MGASAGSVESTGFRLASGIQGIHPGVHQSRRCYRVVISRCAVDSGRGGFPKIRPCRWRCPALRPPAYEIAQEGTRNQWVSGTDPGWSLLWPPRKPATRPVPARSSPEYTAIDSDHVAICLAVQCLAGKCLKGAFHLTEVVGLYAARFSGAKSPTPRKLSKPDLTKLSLALRRHFECQRGVELAHRARDAWPLPQ